MLPWFLCLLSVVSENLPGGSEDVGDEGSRVWWNPVETAPDLVGFDVQEGDVLVPVVPGDGNLKNAILSKTYLWEDGVIPYDFNEDFSCSEKDEILKAMKILEEKTCVRFTQKDNQDTFIRFEKRKNGCYAPIGRLSGNEGPLPVNLQSPECLKRGIIEHELLHVMGLFHEQSRPDRDDFVTVHWCNIEPSKERDFRKASPRQVTTFGLPYDFGSIMHYPRWAFSRNGRPTITAKGNPNMTLGQREHPSESDFEKVVRMYECKAAEEGERPAGDGDQP